jgi:serine/threonine-protein kinase
LKPDGKPVQAASASPLPTPQGTADTSPDSASPLTNSFPPTDRLSALELEPAHPAIRPCASLDGYVLLETIGRGGMGIVFKAKQPNSEQIVALKMIRDGIFADQDAHDRFLQEIRAMGRLQSTKNIVPIYHVGQFQSCLFYVMPFLAAGSLSNLCKRYPNEPRQALAIVEKVARAVHQLHLNKILHRDIKPSNILLDGNDEPYLSDFGLAKLIDQEKSLTGSQQRLGTPAYMAPEQTGLIPTPVSAHTDIWALGVLLYELLTGTRPFFAPDAEISTTLLWKIVHEQPARPRKVQPNIDAALEAVILKCLEKQPADRFASAQDLADELARWQRGESLRTKPASRIRRITNWARHNKGKATLGAVVLLFGIAVAVTLAPRDPEEPLRAMQREAAKGATITIVPEKGQPRYSKVLTPGAAFTHLNPEGFYAITTDHLCLVELMRDISFRAFQFKAKLRHDAGQELGKVGLFLNHSVIMHDQSRIHSYYQWGYNDVIDLRDRAPNEPNLPPHLQPLPAPEGNRVELQPIVFVEEGPSKQFLPFGSELFLAEGPRGKRWRTLSVSVHPDRIGAQFDNSSIPAQPLERCTLSTQQGIDLYKKASSKHAWMVNHIRVGFDPRGSVGLVVMKGTLTVSDVTISPLSPPAPEEQER